MSNLTPFKPQYGNGKTLAVTDVSAEVVLEADNTEEVLITNAGDNIIFIKIGSGSQTATAADLPFLPNSAQVIQRKEGENNLAAVCLSGESSTLYAMTGEGE